MKKLFLFLIAINLYANKPIILDAKLTCNKVCNINVTIKHNDSSWKHYVNKYEIYAKNNKIATRILYHPHIHEQPFTRSKSGFQIPKNTTSITIKAYDLVDGYSNDFILKLN